LTEKLTASAQEKIDSEFSRENLQQESEERINSEFKREFTAKLKSSGSG
jgi:hypothetical protein